ncbi:MAG: hypothetical protein C0399_00105 [Syntrophus sp. (in: bacteria)]|nr:hypothetical protein [Syntrophus sp. (in: bacteria)]
MHQSSYNIMSQFRNLVTKHFQGNKVRILDVGSHGVNGTYKEIFTDDKLYSYTGLDLQPGPNVDYVPSGPYCWPELQDESFDVIISGQAFEHIEYPWLIIEEINRVLKKNGLICIVAPSRGPEHKYPVDCWRYYPDGFRALAKWVHLEVLEAKTSWGKSGFSDGSDQWGDTFCILYKPENQDKIIQHERKAKSVSQVVNRNNPLRQSKQNSYYGFARPEVVEAIIKNNLPTGKVLEIGCAGGATGKNLKERLPVQSYVGIDISPEAADIAKNYLDRVIVANIEKTDLASEHGLKPGEFDLLLALDVLEHLYDPWDILAELSHYVKPGGYVVVSLPNIQNITIVQGLIKGNWQYQDAGILDATHLRFFTLEASIKMFSGAGLTIKSIEHVINPTLDIETVKESGNKYQQGNLEIANLTKNELLHLFTYQYILIAQKTSSTEVLNTASTDSTAPGGDLLLPHFKQENIVPELSSIIILAFNELEYTKRCVKSIRKHTPEPHEIIFVDNGSTDGTVKWLSKLVQENDNYQLIENKENLGFAKGCNQGIEASHGEFILLLNNDVILVDKWLSGMLGCLNSASDVGIVGPLTNNISGPQQIVSDEYRSVDYLDKYAAQFRKKHRHRRIPLRRIVGFCMLFKRALAEQIGMLDESFGTGNFEDDDFCLRAALKGYRNLVAGDVFIHHYGSRSFIGNKIDYSASISGNRKIIEEKWTLSTLSPEGKKLAALKATELADDLNQKGKTDQAIGMLIDGIKITPEAKEIYYALARIFVESKRFAEALEVVESMPESAREELKGLEYAGYAKEGLGLDDEAATYTDRMLSLDKKYPPALNLKGVLGYKRGHKETAADFFRRALDSDPGYGEAYTNLGVLQWTAEKRDEALDYLKKGFVLSPIVPDTSSLYYSVVSSLGTYRDAENVFRETKGLYPNNKNITFLYIDALIQQGKFSVAMIEIEDAIAWFGLDEGILAAALSVREKLGPRAPGEKGPKKTTLSVCMIVKNEEKHLVKCLKSVRDIVDEMIVVDTGSTDRTRDMAVAFGAQVFDFKWNDDFSAARNLSLSKAIGDWILILDADEVISSLDHKRLLKTIDIGKQRPVAFDIVTRNYLVKSGSAGWTGNDGAYPQEEKGVGWFGSNKVRLFKNNNLVRFENPVHELIEASLNRAGIPIEKCTIPIHHYGRLDHDKLLAKGLDYCLLGRKKLEERGGGDYVAIRELAVQATEIGKFDEAIDLWQQALALRADDVEALFNLAYDYMCIGKYQEALQAAKRSVELSPGTKDAVLNYALCEMLMGNVLKTTALLEESVSSENENPTLTLPEHTEGFTSIIIPVSEFNDNIRKCLESINANAAEPYEIILVKNGSLKVPAWLKKYTAMDTHCKIIGIAKNTGFSGMCNEGLQKAIGQYVLILDGNVIMLEGSLEKMRKCMDQDPEHGIIVPMSNNAIGPQQIPKTQQMSCRDFEEYARTFCERNQHRYIITFEIDCTCTLIKKTFINTIGLLNEQIETPYFAINDYRIRALMEGQQAVIAGNICVYLNQSGTRNKGSDKAFHEKWDIFNPHSATGGKLSPFVAIKNARDHHSKGLLDESVQAIMEGIKYTPEEEELYYCLAEILLEEKQYEEAIDAIRAMPRTGQDKAGALEILGYCNYYLGHLEEADNYADRAFSLSGNSAKALNLKGLMALKQKDQKNAEALFQQAVAMNPCFADPYMNMGIMKWHDSEQKEALDLIEKGFILSPETGDFSTTYNSGITSLNELSRAERVFMEACGLFPKNRRLSFLFIGVLLQQEKYGEAMEEIVKAILAFGVDDETLSAALTVREKIGPLVIDGGGKKRNALSVCMIVKNEETYMARCMASLTPVADEIIVVDTGSTDRTRGIAIAFGAQIFDFPWTDDFSEARNVSLEKAKGDWILVHDADEVLSPLDYAEFKKLLQQKHSKPFAYDIITRNYIMEPAIDGWTANVGEYHEEESGSGWFPSNKVRLFTNDRRILFCNTVHEILEPSIKQAGIEIKPCSIPIHHYGKLPSETNKKKGDVYYQLGKRKVELMGNIPAAHRELAIQAEELGKHEEAIEHWQAYARAIPKNALPYFNMASIYLEMGQFELALDAAKKACEIDPHAKETILTHATVSLCAGDAYEAATNLEKLLETVHNYPPAQVALGMAYCITGRKEQGITLMTKMREKGYNYDPALYSIAKKLISAGRIEQAMSLLESMMKWNSTNQDTIALFDECKRAVLKENT